MFSDSFHPSFTWKYILFIYQIVGDFPDVFLIYLLFLSVMFTECIQFYFSSFLRIDLWFGPACRHSQPVFCVSSENFFHVPSPYYLRHLAYTSRTVCSNKLVFIMRRSCSLLTSDVIWASCWVRAPSAWLHISSSFVSFFFSLASILK